MAIERLGITSGANGRPIISRALVRGDTVYLGGILAEPGRDVNVQTRQVLDQIDEQVRLVGTSKAKLLTWSRGQVSRTRH